MTKGCDYTGSHFGASYPDACCIDGYLWDLDSCDEPGGPLYSGGEQACPQCNTAEWLDDARNDAADGGCGTSMRWPWCAATVFESCVHLALEVNEPEARKWLAACKPFATDDWADRQAVYDGRASWEVTVERTWPWPIEAHEP